MGVVDLADAESWWGGIFSWPSRWATTCQRESAGSTGRSPARAASSAQARGTINALLARRVASAKGSTPGTARSLPSRASSPAHSTPSNASTGIWPDAARMPSAMGRSKRPPSLGRSAGARLRVMRLVLGKSKPALIKALRTRSRLSFTAVSGRPTSVRPGKPFARCTSTCTAGASNPTPARVATMASVIAFPLQLSLTPM